MIRVLIILAVVAVFGVSAAPASALTWYDLGSPSWPSRSYAVFTTTG